MLRRHLCATAFSFEMLVAIHQLHYLPWLRYFHKIAPCDVFVVLDNIQFNKNGWQNRNKIKTDQGSAILSVPVLQKRAQNLADVMIDNKQPWRRKHWGAILNHYRKAPYFKDHEAFFEKIYASQWEKLNDLNYEMLSYFLKVLGVKTKLIRGSEMPMRGEATERLVGICKDLSATAYLTGAYAVEVYLDSNLFELAGIDLIHQNFHRPEYTQQYPEVGFVPELAILDLLFNCGPKSLEILMNQQCAGTSKGNMV